MFRKTRATSKFRKSTVLISIEKPNVNVNIKFEYLCKFSKTVRVHMYVIYLYEYTSIYVFCKQTCIKLLFKLINDYFNNLTIISRNNFVINSNINF